MLYRPEKGAARGGPVWRDLSFHQDQQLNGAITVSSLEGPTYGAQYFRLEYEMGSASPHSAPSM